MKVLVVRATLFTMGLSRNAGEQLNTNGKIVISGANLNGQP